MLAVAPLPRGSDADLAVVSTLSEGYSTVRCLAALPRRLRSMGRTVCSITLCQTVNSTAFRSHQCCLPMAGDPKTSALIAKRAAQHVRLSRANDAYERLCILTVLSSL